MFKNKTILMLHAISHIKQSIKKVSKNLKFYLNIKLKIIIIFWKKNIPNEKRAINNRFNHNTINFNNISEIKKKNEQDISNSSEIKQKMNTNKKYKKGIRFDKYKKIDRQIKRELKPNFLDIFDNNFDHHEKFIEKKKIYMIKWKFFNKLYLYIIVK